jgi:hypothetical protein
MAFLGWGSLKTVEKIHSFCESLETISLAAAIFMELAGMKRPSNIAWVVLVISDVGRQLYGRREKSLTAVEAEGERSARLKLERKLADRHLTPTHKSDMIAALKAFDGQCAVVVFDPNDEEIAAFSVELIGTLREARWKVVIGGTAINVLGVKLNLGPDCTWGDANSLWCLLLLLTRAGIYVESEYNPAPRPITAEKPSRNLACLMEVTIGKRV